MKPTYIKTLCGSDSETKRLKIQNYTLFFVYCEMSHVCLFINQRDWFRCTSWVTFQPHKPKLKLSTKIQNTCEGRVDTDSPWFDKDCEKITLTLLLNNSVETLQSIKHVQQSSENITSKV